MFKHELHDIKRTPKDIISLEYYVYKQDRLTTVYCFGKIHCDDGPAIIASNELRWYQHGELHRDDGPAIIGRLGTPSYYIRGQRIDKNNLAYNLIKAKENDSDKIHSSDIRTIYNKWTPK